MVKFWDSRTGEELAAIPLPSQRVSTVSISVDGSRIAYACNDAATKGVASGEAIRILEVASPEQAVTIPLAGPATFRFSPDGQRLFVSGSPTASSDTVQESRSGVFNASTGQRLFAVPDTASWSLSQWSPDGKWLAVTSYSRPRSVKLYRTIGDRAPVEFRGHTNTVIALHFSPDSQRLLTTGGDGCIKTWDVAATAFEPVRQPSVTASSSLLTVTVVSSDGKRIATAPTKSRFSPNTLQADSRKKVVTVRDDAGNVLHETAEPKGDRAQMMKDLQKGIVLSPEVSDTWSDRAWLLATSPNAEHGDGKLAVAAANKACERSYWNEFDCLDVLAAAYAENDEFEQAVKWQTKVVEMLPPSQRADYASRLKLYKEGKPYREPLAGATR